MLRETPKIKQRAPAQKLHVSACKSSKRDRKRLNKNDLFGRVEGDPARFRFAEFYLTHFFGQMRPAQRCSVAIHSIMSGGNQTPQTTRRWKGDDSSLFHGCTTKTSEVMGIFFTWFFYMFLL